jgi:hypothetical protein
MRTISSMAALHRGQDKVLPDSDIPLRRLKFESRHMNNGGNRVEFRRLVFLWGCSRFRLRFVRYWELT